MTMRIPHVKTAACVAATIAFAWIAVLDQDAPWYFGAMWTGVALTLFFLRVTLGRIERKIVSVFGQQ